jgi:hypothetical protein
MDNFDAYNTAGEVDARVHELEHAGNADAFVYLNAHLRKEQIRSQEGMYNMILLLPHNQYR